MNTDHESAERWALVARDERYEVSDLGRVRNRATGYVLAPTQNSSRAGHRPGYWKVTFRVAGRVRNHYVHHLVAEAFLGPRPPGHDIDHDDWDRANNAAANLVYRPQQENRVRWRGPGRNDFEITKHAERVAPEGHEPMTDAELEQLGRELAEAGWSS